MNKLSKPTTNLLSITFICVFHTLFGDRIGTEILNTYFYVLLKTHLTVLNCYYYDDDDDDDRGGGGGGDDDDDDVTNARIS